MEKASSICQSVPTAQSANVSFEIMTRVRVA
jgi:hypothetical protein